jgi:hypothetical protein
MLAGMETRTSHEKEESARDLKKSFSLAVLRKDR